jgi:hypothetical protein
MPLTNAGRDHIATNVIGETVTSFNNASAHIGVGSSPAAFAVTQTQLATQLMRRPMDATFPTRTGNTLTFRSTFGTEDANGAWEEWGVFNAATGGTLLNRRVETLGIKPSTQTWQFSVTLTINAA